MKVIFELITILSAIASIGMIIWFIADHDRKIIEQSMKLNKLEETLAKEQGRLIVLMDFVQARSFALPTGFNSSAFDPAPIIEPKTTIEE